MTVPFPPNEKETYVQKRYVDCGAECPLLAQSGHELVHRTCPLSGVERTSLFALHMSAYDPKRTCVGAKGKPWSPERGSDKGLEEMGLGTVTLPLGENTRGRRLD